MKIYLNPFADKIEVYTPTGKEKHKMGDILGELEVINIGKTDKKRTYYIMRDGEGKTGMMLDGQVVAGMHK